MDKLKFNSLKLNYKDLTKRNNKHELKLLHKENNDSIHSPIRTRTLKRISNHDLFPLENSSYTSNQLNLLQSDTIPINNHKKLNLPISKIKQNIPINIKQITQAYVVTKLNKIPINNDKKLLPNTIINSKVISKNIVETQNKIYSNRRNRGKRISRSKHTVKKNRIHQKKIEKSVNKTTNTEKDIKEQVKHESKLLLNKNKNIKKIKHAYRITKNIITKEKLSNPYRYLNNEQPYNLDTVFDKIFILNLVEDKDKKANMIARFNNIGIKPSKYYFFEAINGYQRKEMIKRKKCLAEREKKQKGIITSKEKRLLKNPGAWGYLQSYIHIIEQVLKDKKINRILMFDDDVLFDNNFIDKFNKSLTQFPEKFEIIWFGTSQRKWHYTSFPTKKNGKTYYTAGFDQIRGSFALGIDRIIFKPLLDELRKYRAPVDNAFDVIPYNPNRCYIIYPNICIADLRTGKINGKRSMELGRKKFKWKLENFNL